MNSFRLSLQILCTLWLVSACTLQTAVKPFQPYSGQPGKDSVWVPTPAATLDKMMEVAHVTAKDFVMDLGSGDGRNVIAAAKRGARALGVEFNLDMVKLSQDNAVSQGVADKAKFVKGDMFTADISEASVLALFLLPDNLRKLSDKFLNLRPGTRIVVNTFGIEGWEPAHSEAATGDCGDWCSVILYIVPAKVAGHWRLDDGELNLQQKAQTLTGTLIAGGVIRAIENGRVDGDQVAFTAGGVEYNGRIDGGTISGLLKGNRSGTWKATRTNP